MGETGHGCQRQQPLQVGSVGCIPFLQVGVEEENTWKQSGPLCAECRQESQGSDGGVWTWRGRQCPLAFRGVGAAGDPLGVQVKECRHVL